MVTQGTGMENMDTMGATGPMAADGEYTDIHTHILPGIDDGASDLSVSEQML
ncbi:CpsB/CapC family capsule biosynthesis tyrosine phosphatase, partial [Proteiniphilum sp. UBA7639]|uniref:CpsB/CapC family capsule biosynthesis tyrosine phosphatase n=1 Tax=Proteiniphilum sp. UBA7639 TaxID=1947289 RepID=UPI0039C9B3ED